MRRMCAAETLTDAPAEAIWAVVRDVTRVGERSGQCRGCSWAGVPGEAVPRVRESFTVLKMPRLMEWLVRAALPAHRDRTSDLEADLEPLKNLVENSPRAR
jgi:hypothetical protein